MRYPHKLFALKVGHYPLYAFTFFVTGLASLLIKSVPFSRLSFLLGKRSTYVSREPTVHQLARINQISLALQRVAKYTPWRCKCFEQGLTAKLLLQLTGVQSTLVFGVTYDENVKLLAHAWLTCGSVVVTGGSGADQFKEIAVFT
ncbi:lasso peptide biosynthesis B2 protein [Spirosoma rigui]|uniref:lasso peptide biosynthesis B2 protein n=1 Tax=Spirosoma rigui TaxID=564064 RepID=UPI0009B0D515